MRITCISDTHGLHSQLKFVPGDLLIHAGDISEYGTEDEIFDFTQWFAKQPFTYKIFIAGNHDLFLETIPLKTFRELIGNELIYLQNSEVNHPRSSFKYFGQWKRLSRFETEIASNQTKASCFRSCALCQRSNQTRRYPICKCCTLWQSGHPPDEAEIYQ